MRNEGTLDGNRTTPDRTMTRLPLLATVLILAACREADTFAPPPDPQQLAYAPELHVDLHAMTRTASGLYLLDVRLGDGDQVADGDTVRILYAAWLPNGTLVEARSTPAEPAEFVLGDGTVIAGWEEGISGMREGGLRKLVIPPDLGFGRSGKPPVPPNAILVVDIELLVDGT